MNDEIKEYAVKNMPQAVGKDDYYQYGAALSKRLNAYM